MSKGLSTTLGHDPPLKEFRVALVLGTRALRAGDAAIVQMLGNASRLPGEAQPPLPRTVLSKAIAKK